jgi:hypothetical protein
MLHSDRHTRWNEILCQLRSELNCIAEEELLWMRQRIALIQELQKQIHALFLDANGSTICANCSGSCCEHGHNHIALINVIAAMLHQKLPEPDFSSTCPFLTPSGCSLSVTLRPFNCVTFICDGIEERMDAEQMQEFYRLEKLLRAHYLEVDQRYAGSSLRGLFIGTERLGDRRLLEQRIK